MIYLLRKVLLHNAKKINLSQAKMNKFSRNYEKRLISDMKYVYRYSLIKRNKVSEMGEYYVWRKSINTIIVGKI
jgi:hypothetical protein